MPSIYGVAQECGYICAILCLIIQFILIAVYQFLIIVFLFYNYMNNVGAWPTLLFFRFLSVSFVSLQMCSSPK